MYITARVSETQPKQLSFEDIFLAMLNEAPPPSVGQPRGAYYRTYYCQSVPEKVIEQTNVPYLIEVLKRYNDRWGYLLREDMSVYYTTGYIPKKTGGKRRIDAPNDDLKRALSDLVYVFQHDFHAKSHAAAHAYEKGNSTITAVKVHQRNDSRWFLKTDLSGFFPNTTLKYTLEMLHRVYPFGLVMQDSQGFQELKKALSLGFLNGGLPQGTPLSPMLTNIIMIPFDHEFSRYLRGRYKPENNLDHRGRMFVYTRYADDMDISCRIWFNYHEVIKKIKEIFAYFEAPYVIKPEKTHYGSRNGKNWMLGVMLNGKNEITIGHKKKEQLRAILHNYCADRKNGKPWDQSEVRWLQGIISYYKMVNKEAIMNTIYHVGYGGFHMDIEKAISEDLAM